MPVRCPLCGATTKVLGQHEDRDLEQSDNLLGGVTWGCPRCRVTFYLIAGVHRLDEVPGD